MQSILTNPFLAPNQNWQLSTSEIRHADVPSLLHFAAQYGFKSVSSLLLQCPGAERALHTANRHGQTPTEIAKSHGHTELHVLLKETLVTSLLTIYSSHRVCTVFFLSFLFFWGVVDHFSPRSSWNPSLLENIVLVLLTLHTMKTFLKMPICDDSFSCPVICELIKTHPMTFFVYPELRLWM